MAPELARLRGDGIALRWYVAPPTISYPTNPRPPSLLGYRYRLISNQQSLHYSSLMERDDRKSATTYSPRGREVLHAKKDHGGDSCLVTIISPTTASGITIGEWATSEGYGPGAVMPRMVNAFDVGIDSLSGISDYDWSTTPTINLNLSENEISSIEPNAFRALGKLKNLYLYENRLSSIEAALQLRTLSGVDFANIFNLAPLYFLDDLTELWLLRTSNLDAGALDVLLNNLSTIEGTAVERLLFMTEADFDAFNTAGGDLLAAWDAELGHHVVFVVPEPATATLIALLLAGVWGYRARN